MDNLAVASLLVFLASIANAAFVLSAKPRDLLKSLWGLISLFVSAVGLHLYWLLTDTEPVAALHHSLVLNSIVIFIPLFFFHFTLLLTNRYFSKKKEMFVYYGITLAYAVLVFLNPRSFIPSVGPVASLKYYVQPGVLFYFLPIWLVYLMGRGLLLVLRSYRHAPILRRNQFKYFILGSLLGLIGGVSAFLPAINIPIYPWGIYLIPLGLLTVAYGIVRHQLMDIQVIIQKSLIYTILVSFMTVLFFVFIYISEQFFREMLGYTSEVSSLVAVALITLIIVPIYRLAQTTIDKMFYRGSLTQIFQENLRLQGAMLTLERYKIFQEITKALVKEIKAPIHLIKNESHGRMLKNDVQSVELTLSELEEYSQAFSSDFSEINMISILDGLLNSVFEVSKSHQPAVFKYYQAEDVVKVLGNAEQLRQAFSSILNHCLQVTKSGGDIFVTVEYDKKWVSISIRHSGHGLTEDEVMHLFQPFYKTMTFRCGLRLILAQAIVLQHQGKISVESEPEVGTEFLVELPIL